MMLDDDALFLRSAAHSAAASRLARERTERELAGAQQSLRAMRALLDEIVGGVAALRGAGGQGRPLDEDLAALEQTARWQARRIDEVLTAGSERIPEVAR